MTFGALRQFGDGDLCAIIGINRVVEFMLKQHDLIASQFRFLPLHKLPPCSTSNQHQDVAIFPQIATAIRKINKPSTACRLNPNRVSGKALAAGLVSVFAIRNRRIAPCRSLNQQALDELCYRIRTHS